MEKDIKFEENRYNNFFIIISTKIYSNFFQNSLESPVSHLLTKISKNGNRTSLLMNSMNGNDFPSNKFVLMLVQFFYLICLEFDSIVCKFWYWQNPSIQMIWNENASDQVINLKLGSLFLNKDVTFTFRRKLFSRTYLFYYSCSFPFLKIHLKRFPVVFFKSRLTFLLSSPLCQ